MSSRRPPSWCTWPRLLHDDVIDDGQERRGRPTSRRIWGNAVSVLAGDLLLTHALERTAASAPAPVLSDLFATLRRLVDGEVVQLRGRLRLDPRAVELRHVENRVNGEILRDQRVQSKVMGREEALAYGALAFFGDKYGERVRVVEVPGFSKEFCGGTHVEATGEIGLFLLTAEQGISAGTRRVEALTGEAAVARAQADQGILEELEQSRTSPITRASSSFSVWSARIANDRINERPELIIVAN